MANTWHYYEVHTEKCLLTTLVPCAKYICHLEATTMLRNCITSQVAHTFLLTKKISLQSLKQNMASILSHGLDFLFFFFKGWQISLLKSELLVIHLLQWWFSWLLTSNRKHCSPSQNKSSLCCSNLSISANNSHSCSNWVHVAPVTLELLPADTWMFMTGWCFHLVPGQVCFILF